MKSQLCLNFTIFLDFAFSCSCCVSVLILTFMCLFDVCSWLSSVIFRCYVLDLDYGLNSHLTVYMCIFNNHRVKLVWLLVWPENDPFWHLGSVDCIWYVYAVSCFGNHKLSPFKGCLDVMTDLSYRLWRVLFLFYVDSTWSK